jgi:hypothetical protein
MTEANIIGYLIWWRFWPMYVNYDALQRLIHKVEIDYTLPPLKYRTAFLKAVQEIKRTYRNKGILVRRLYKSKNLIKVSLIEEQVDRESICHTYPTILSFDPIQGKITCPQPHRGFDLIQCAYQQYLNSYNVDDIRICLVEILQPALPINFRQHGGFYFVGVEHFELIRKLEQLVYCLPGKCIFCAIPQIDSDRTKRAMSVALDDSLEYQIKTLDQDVRGSTKHPQGLFIPASLHKRLRVIESMQKQIDTYKDILVFDSEKHINNLAALRKLVRERLYLD